MYKVSLKAARVNADLTQEDAAKRLKVSKITICHWETGTTSPSTNDLMKLSSLYKIPIELIRLPGQLTFS